MRFGPPATATRCTRGAWPARGDSTSVTPGLVPFENWILFIISPSNRLFDSREYFIVYHHTSAILPVIWKTCRAKAKRRRKLGPLSVGSAALSVSTLRIPFRITGLYGPGEN